MATYTKSELARAGRMPAPWKAPSLKPEGRPFAPAGLEAGVMVAWGEREPVRSLAGIPTGAFDTIWRSGQVWALGPINGTRWVAPSDGGSAVLLREVRGSRGCLLERVGF